MAVRVSLGMTLVMVMGHNGTAITGFDPAIHR
jgi:hypothetical protein